MSTVVKHRGIRLAAAVAGLVVLLAAGGAWAASGGPFGVMTPDSGGSGIGGPFGGFFLRVALLQQHFYKALTASLSALRENPWGVWLLLALSFGYGVFHAAGPGHGKAVIASYLVSSGETVRRGVALSFAAAFVQAASAIVIVGIGAILLRATAMQMAVATDWIEILSYAAITLVGVWLLWSKTFGGGHHHHHHHHHHVGGDHHDHHHDHDHAHADAAQAPGGRAAGAWSSVLAVGIRPCSGAIIVLVFALSQGLIAAGVAATLVMALGTGLTVALLATLAVSAKGMALRLAGGVESRTARVVVRAAEICAALCVFLFGAVLLGGALAGGLPG